MSIPYAENQAMGQQSQSSITSLSCICVFFGIYICISLVELHPWKCTTSNQLFINIQKSNLGLDVFTAQCYNMTLTDFRSTTIYFHSYCHKPVQCTVITIVTLNDFVGIKLKFFFDQGSHFLNHFPSSKNDSVRLVLPHAQSLFSIALFLTDLDNQYWATMSRKKTKTKTDQVPRKQLSQVRIIQ